MFGAYAGNWNPHAYAIVTDGVFTPEGEFLALPALDTSVVLEVFRRLWLRRLHQAERLSEAFMNKLLSWVHPGFCVFSGAIAIRPGIALNPARRPGSSEFNPDLRRLEVSPAAPPAVPIVS
jgi:hypothetical protein